MAGENNHQANQPRHSGDVTPNNGQDEGLTSSVSRKEKDQTPAVHAEETLEALKGEVLPSTEAPLEALGIPNWRELEKKVVQRLDMTLMPCLIVLYLFNYLDRASIAYVSNLKNTLIP